MDRPALPERSGTRLGDRLRAYSRPLARLSRLGVPCLRPLASSHLPAMLRPGCLVFTTACGDARVRVDLAQFPALESIARDDDPGRRVALANLLLAPWLGPLRAGSTDIGIGPLAGLAIGDLVLTPPSPVGASGMPGALPADGANGLPMMVAVGAFAPLPCIVEHIAPTLVAALAGPDDVPRDGTAPARGAGPAHGAAILHTLLLPGRLRIASRRYRTAVLASLRHGDVLLGWPLREPYHPDAAIVGCALLWGAPGGTQYRMLVDADGPHITLKGGFTMTNDTLDYAKRGFAGDADPHALDAAAADMATGPDAPAYAPHPGASNALDALEVLVHVEVGALTLPLATLAAMGPGHVLELPTPVADAPVRLVSCGRVLGTGELVAVGDNLGVRITHLAADDGR